MSEKSIALSFRSLPSRFKDQIWSFIDWIYKATKIYPNCQLFINQAEPWPDIILLCQLAKDKFKYHYSYFTLDFMENEQENQSKNLVEFLDKYFQYYKELDVNMTSMVIYKTQSIYFGNWFQKTTSRLKKVLSGREYYLILTDEAIQKLVGLFLKRNQPETELEMYKAYLATIKIKIYPLDEYTMSSYPFSTWTLQHLDETTANVLLFQHFIDWLQDGKGTHQGTLLNKHLDKWIDTFKKSHRNVTLEEFSKISLKYFGIFAVSFQEFPDDLHRFFDSSTSKILGIPCHSTFLTTLKILDYVAKNKKTVMFLTDVRIRKMSQLDLPVFGNDLVIVECTHVKKTSVIKSIFNFMKRVVDMEKKIIFIHQQIDPMLHKLYKKLKMENHIYPHVRFTDHTSYAQLSEEAQDLLLDNLIYFQKYDIPLRRIANRATITNICSTEYLEKLIKTLKISIGKYLEMPITSSIYFERTLRRQSIEIELLRDCFSLSSIVLIMGITKEHLNQLHLNASSWTGEDFRKNGLYVFSGREETSTVYEQCTLYDQTLNVFWLEYSNCVFFVERFQSHRRDLLKVISDVDHTEHIDIKKFCRRPGVKILVDDPGMGKSNFLSYYAHELKRQNQNLWVIMINLDCQNLPFYLTDATEMERFLLKNELGALGPDTQFEKELLLLSLTSRDDQFQYPKVAFLFDAFHVMDEINQSTALDLVQKYTNKGINVFIACRPHEKTRLELVLQSSAYRLNSLKEVEKMDYLKENLDILDYKGNFFEFFVKIRRIFESINQTGFSGNPSNLYLLVKHSSNTKTILKMFGELIYLKISLSSLQFKSRDIISYLGAMAVSKIRPVKYKKEIPLASLLQMGFLTLDDDGLLIFIHSYYQDYFLAEYISTADVDCEILVQVFTEQKYQFLRLLLDDAPPECHPGDLIRELNNPIVVIQSIMREGCKNLVKYLLYGMSTFNIEYDRCDRSNFIWCRNYSVPIELQIDGQILL